jgi:hypothetical protein
MSKINQPSLNLDRRDIVGDIPLREQTLGCAGLTQGDRVLKAESSEETTDVASHETVP